MKNATYSYNEAFQKMGVSKNAFAMLERNRIIVKESRGKYLVDSVDRYVACKRVGYSASQIEKELHIDRPTIYALASIGILKRVYPKYLRSNFTSESVETLRTKQFNNSVATDLLSKSMEALEALLSAWALETDKTEVPQGVYNAAFRTYQEIKNTI